MLLKAWCQSIWLYVMLILGTAVSIALSSNWDVWSQEQKIVAAIYILLPLHAWEEWRIPGGFGYQYNWVMANSDRPDRYPMDQLSDMTTVLGAMVFGIALLAHGVTPGILISQTVFSCLEVGMHTYFGIQMLHRLRSKGKRTLYNPGLATAIAGFLPLAVAGFIRLAQARLEALDFLVGLGLTAVLAAITFIPEKIARERSADFAFSPGYYRRFLNHDS